MTRSIGEDQQTDATVDEQLERLGEALSQNDIDAIHSAAHDTISTVRDAAGQRLARQDAQIEAMSDKIQALKNELTEAREQASVDALTKLYNRGAFDEHIDRLADLGMLLGTPVSLLLSDVDHFKQVNDTHGHPTGDQVLKSVANALQRTFLRKQDFVARYGGEEFVIVIVDASPDEAVTLAERALKSIRSTKVKRNDATIQVTASIGIANMIAGESVSAWLERADKALYEAKEAGRDRVVVAPLVAEFDPATSQRPSRRVSRMPRRSVRVR